MNQDVILLLGTDFPYANFIPQNKKIIQIDDKPEKLGRRANLEIGVCGKIKDSIQALLPLIQEKSEQSFLDAHLELYEKVKGNLLTYVHDTGKPNAIHPEFVAATINELADADAILPFDTGMCCVWGARYIAATGKRKLLGSFNHGSMANAMPQAIGAALSHPEQQVIAFCGDGGLSMLLGDLATIKQYNLPIKLVVFNNRTLGMVKLEMEVAGLPITKLTWLIQTLRWLHKQWVLKGSQVNEPENVRAAIAEAFAHPGPVLVNVMTDPEALAMPPKIEFAQMKGYAITMGKMILGGKMDEVLDTVKSNYKHIKDIL